MKILFRGKSLDSGEWFYGYYCGYDGEVGLPSAYFIIESKDGECITHPVDPNTVGQYTGLLDMNGKMVFDGDITKELSDQNRQWVVFSTPGGFGTCRTFDFNSYRYFFYEGLANLQNGGWLTKSHKVIGNIYDNPELLGGDSVAS